MSRSQKFSLTFTVDDLFPSDTNRSGTTGKALDVETLFINASLNNEPDLSFSSDILVNRIQKRRKKKLWCFKTMLKYCYDRIEKADDDQLTDIMFNVVDVIPDCKEYNSLECLEYITEKLREQKFDVLIVDSSTIFISWKFIEIKKED